MLYFLVYLYMYFDVCGCVKGEYGIEMELCMKMMFLLVIYRILMELSIFY